MADNEALRLADALEQYAIDANSGDPRIVEAVAELRRLAGVEAGPLNLRDPAVQKRLATQWGYVPAAQAEPVQRNHYRNLWPERNFCSRCGKRLADEGIHTCTLPQTTQEAK